MGTNLTKGVGTDQPRSPANRMYRVYFWIVSFMLPYRAACSLLIAAIAVISVSELLVAKLIQYFIDGVDAMSDPVYFYGYLGAIALLVTFLFAGRVLQNVTQNSLQERAARDMQYAVIDHMRKLGFAYFEHHPAGETLSLLNTEVAAVQNMYRQAIPWLLHEIIFSAVSVALMLHTSWELTLLAIPCLLLYYVFGPYLETKASLAGQQMAADRIHLNQTVYDALSALPELRASSTVRWGQSLVLDRLNGFSRIALKHLWYANLRGANRKMTLYAGGIAIFACGFVLHRSGSLTVGEFTVFMMYFFSGMQTLTALISNFTEQRILVHQAARLYAFMEREPAVKEDAQPVFLPDVKGEIRLEDVEFGYDSGSALLQGLNLTIKPGQRVALVGASGCGKSTILKLIGRFYDPQRGTVTLDGVPLFRLSFAQLRQTMGFVFQEPYLFGTTVRENIRFGRPEATDGEMIDAAKAANAHEFIMELPQGYDTVVGERAVLLSGGQKQRIALARLFLKNPAVLILDEATSALDTINDIKVQQAISKLMKDRTIITVAHKLSTIKEYDVICVIQNGAVAEAGSFEQLLRLGGIFYRMAAGGTWNAAEDVHGQFEMDTGTYRS